MPVSFQTELKLDAAHDQRFDATISKATSSTQQNQTLMTVNHLKYRIYPVVQCLYFRLA